MEEFDPNVLSEFVNMVEAETLDKFSSDSYEWLKGNGCIFSVKSYYDVVNNGSVGFSIGGEIVKAINHLREVKVPSNILFFGWRFLLNRIPTKDQLFKQGILTNKNCAFCMVDDESISHLFGRCLYSDCIWIKVFNWIGSGMELSLSKLVSFFLHCEKVKNKVRRLITAVIWLATVWSIWLMQNTIILKNSIFNFYDCMTMIVLRSWTWLSAFCKTVDGCNFSV
ncbi:uncharacterized protein LOC131650377 [Vicia villosa]|uniref:uncharacterized protein LOC131650377 n=1 Tax=Vicia villosa TaxID=3911 RepID=UPI00273C5110|nr:uncharacterized protein LOC131650377 [Vicia villosa]